MKQKQFLGTIRSFDRNKIVGFLDYEEGSVFFWRDSIKPDWKLSRAWAEAGIPVLFRVISRATPGREFRTCAADMEALMPMSESEDLEDYREISTVLSVSNVAAFLRRPCGDDIFLHKSNVTQPFVPRWATLAVGDHVYHGVAPTLNGKPRAVYAEIFAKGELEAMTKQPEPALVLNPEPEPEPESESELLSPTNRGRTLKDLIDEQRRKNQILVVDFGTF